MKICSAVLGIARSALPTSIFCCLLTCALYGVASLLYYNWVPDVEPNQGGLKGQLVIDPTSPSEAQLGSFFFVGYFHNPALIFDLVGQPLASPFDASSPRINALGLTNPQEPSFTMGFLTFYVPDAGSSFVLLMALVSAIGLLYRRLKPQAIPTQNPRKSIFVIAAAVIALFTTRGKAASFDYVWTGGAPGYAGTIVLDSASSSGGTVNDIISLSFTTPHFGTFAGTPGFLSSDQSFTWTPTRITSMSIGGVGDTILFRFGTGGVWSNFGTGNVIVAHQGAAGNTFDFDDTGTWLAASAVPDHSSTLALMSLAVAQLGLLFLRFKPVICPAGG